MVRGAFTNQSVNWLNLHRGLHTFGTDMTYVFIGIYLYEKGFLLWQIFAVIGMTYLARLILRPLGMRCCFKKGLRKTMMVGAVLYGTPYLALGQTAGHDGWLALFILLTAVVDVLYWLPYHTYWAMLADDEHRGKQVGVRESLNRLGSFLGPLAGGILISRTGFFTTFAIGTGIMVLASLPLLKTPEVPLKNPWPFRVAVRRIQKDGFWLYSAWAVNVQAYAVTWPLVLFIMVRDYVELGGLLSLAIFFQMIGCLWAGHYFDAGHGKKLFPLGLALMGITILGKSLWVQSIPGIIALDLVFMVGYCLFYPVMNAVHYRLVKKSEHPLWFQFMAETGWDVGCMAFTLAAAPLIFFFPGSLREIMLLAFFGMVGMAWFLQAKTQ